MATEIGYRAVHLEPSRRRQPGSGVCYRSRCRGLEQERARLMRSPRSGQSPPIITLLTDFGTRDPYVAAMRGAILSICPSATLVDITHDVPPFEVAGGAYALFGAYAEFPPGTVHLAVVDPGVGGARRPLAARSRRYRFVGPDNGLLGLALDREEGVEVRELQNLRYRCNRVTPTFHGRDLFAPAAAWLARGLPVGRLGRKITAWAHSPLPLPGKTPGGSLRAAVLHIDRFGNVISNVRADTLPRGWVRAGRLNCRARLAGRTVRRSETHFAAAPRGAPFLLINSLGFVELALRESSLARRWRVETGAPITLQREPATGAAPLRAARGI